jgi:hypothetical protein
MEFITLALIPSAEDPGAQQGEESLYKPEWSLSLVVSTYLSKNREIEGNKKSQKVFRREEAPLYLTASVGPLVGRSIHPSVGPSP